MNFLSRLLDYKVAWIAMICSFAVGFTLSISGEILPTEFWESYLLLSPHISTLFSIYIYLVTRKLIVTEKGFKHMNIFYIVFIAYAVFNRVDSYFHLTESYLELSYEWQSYGVIIFTILYGIVFLQLSTTLFNRKKAYSISFIIGELIQLVSLYFSSTSDDNELIGSLLSQPSFIISMIASLVMLVNYFILIQIFYRAAKEVKNDQNQPFQELIDKIGE